MKISKSLVIVAMILTSFVGFAQEPTTVQLSQTPGEFEQTELFLEAGKSYVFEVANNGVDHEVGLVVAPKGKTAQPDHIKEAYVTKTVKDGETQTSNIVTLEKGEYVYFCPLNPTPQYKIVVK